MEVAESREPASVGPSARTGTNDANGAQNPFLDDSLIDDGRSSSLSEPDDVSDHELSPYGSPKLKPVPENDSEAETERVEDSPYKKGNNIVLSASHGPSPSKLAQSTTYDDAEEDDEPVADDSPSKSRTKKNGITAAIDETPILDDSTLSKGGRKRKRLGSLDETGTDFGEDEPLKKRRGSIKSDLSDPPPDDLILSPVPIEEPPKSNEDQTPADDVPESDLPSIPSKAKKGKKGKRKGRKVRDADEETEAGGIEGDDHLDEDDTAERADEPDDVEAAAKQEEESSRKMSAMESLATLEKEFATLRDKIYDERISKLNRELEMLTGPNPTHPEYLRQLECVQRHRDAKIHYEQTLYRYRMSSLMNKSLAERAQIHSTFFQRVRDTRERHASSISKQFYSIQHDRFKTEEISPHHSILFPTRRSQQIAHQTAYNQEVSVMAGVAKYVGFPAAPSLAAARPSEIDEDMEKMGIVTETRAAVSQPQTNFPRMTTMSNTFRTAAEEAFLEHTPWANPQHPVHQQMQQRPQNRVFEQPRAPPFTTPAAQKRVVDIHAPNGSASTIAENSSANNTPYGTEQEPRLHGYNPFGNHDYDADQHSGFRSPSASPLDVRKPQLHWNNAFDSRPSQEFRSDPASRNNMAFSPPSGRLGHFHSAAAKREPSPPIHSKPIHQPRGIPSGTGSNQMTAR